MEIMEKLISNTEYGFYVRSLEVNDHKKLELRENYDSFLKQPLTLGIFVPVMSNGIIPTIEEIKTFEGTPLFEEYQEAKDRVLFEGFELKRGYLIGRLGYGINIEELDNYIVEDLLTHSAKLTPTAQKQIS